MLLYWCAVFALLGCLVAFIVPLRRRWLIWPVVLAAAFFSAGLFWGPLIRDRGWGFLPTGIFLLGMYVLSWAVGVFAGSGLRVRIMRKLRQAWAGRSSTSAP